MKPLPQPRTPAPKAVELNRGISNGVEIAGVLVFFFFAGLGLDAWLHTAPWFTVGFTVLGIVGIFVRAWYGYTTEMDRLDAERRAPRIAASGSAACTSPAGTDPRW